MINKRPALTRVVVKLFVSAPEAAAWKIAGSRTAESAEALEQPVLAERQSSSPDYFRKMMMKIIFTKQRV